MFKSFICIFAVSYLVAFVHAEVSFDESSLQKVEATRGPRDYSYSPSYYGDDELKGKFTGYADYPPQTNYIYKDKVPPICPPSQVVPLLSNGLNFLVLKLGALGIVKALLAVIFFVAVIKIPIIFAKTAFFKAILLPLLMGPLMMLFQNNMMKPNDNNNNNNNGNNGNNNGNFGNNRALDDPMTKTVWQSMKMVFESDKCAERMACQLGAYNNDSASGASLARMAKYLEYSSPAGARARIHSMKDAFVEGNEKGFCSIENYPCTSPQLILQQGDSTLRVL